MCQKSESTHAVADAHQHDSPLGEFLAAVVRFGGGTGVETAAINPNQYRNAVLRRLRRSPKIQVQAILARFRSLARSGGSHALHTGRPEFNGLPHSLPLRGGLGSAPAKIARSEEH